jgi:hypothetical protein
MIYRDQVQAIPLLGMTVTAIERAIANIPAVAADPVRITVKPLVWVDPCAANNWIHLARSVFGDYYISIDGGAHSAWLEANVKPYENKIGDDVGSVIEAMMNAERDYEAKTRQLFDTQPDPRDAVIARLVEALTEVHKKAICLRGDQAYREFARYAEKKMRAAIAAAKGGDA